MNVFLCGTRPGPWLCRGRWLSIQSDFHKYWLGLQSRETELPSPGWFDLPPQSYSWPWGLGGHGLSDFSLFIAPFDSGTENADQHGCFFCSYCLFQKLCRRQNSSHSSFQPCHLRAHFPDPFSTWPQKCLGDESLWKDLRVSPASALGMEPCLQKPRVSPVNEWFSGCLGKVCISQVILLNLAVIHLFFPSNLCWQVLSARRNRRYKDGSARF